MAVSDDNVTQSDADSFARQAAKPSPGILAEFIGFMLQNKKWWLTPIILVLLLVGFLIVQVGSSVVAPFIYPFF